MAVQSLNQMIKQQAGVTSHIVIQATLTTASPLVMGAGEGDDVEKIITKDSKGKPMVSGSAFIGCIKSYIIDHYEMASLKDANSLEYFWGSKDTKKDETSQSHLQFCPIKSIGNISMQILDGIRISHSSGVVEPTAKYDFECINHVATFKIGLEVVIREGMNADDFNYLVSCMLDTFNNGRLRLGAFTAVGFGQVLFSDIKIQQFIYPDDALPWFTYRQNNTITDNFKSVDVKVKPNKSLQISCTFLLKSSMITGAATGEGFNGKIAPKSSMITGAAIGEGISDKSHYHYDNKPALLGRAVKGAISHRMHKILNTPNPISDGFLDNLLGYGNKTNNTGQQSRLHIDLTIFDKVKVNLQNRIKIDRFLQSTIDGAKFDSEPIWAVGDSTCNIVIKISDATSWDGGLIMHIIKDLWTSDLAIGGEKNIGRGVLIGKKAEMIMNGAKAVITSIDRLSINIQDEKNILSQFNDAFNEKNKTSL